MAELDFAFLADYAAIQNGKLTAVGASFTHVRAATLPAMQTFSLAGRVRAQEDTPPIALGVAVTGSGGSYELELASVLRRQPEMLAYDGKVGLLFAVTMNLPLLAEGLYVVRIRLDGEDVRRLAFEVELANRS